MLIVSPAIAATADVVKSADPDGSSIQTTVGEPDYAVADLNREYFIGYWTDTKNILTSPARWDSSDWIEASLVVGAAIGLYTQDEKIQTWVQENRNPSRSRFVDDVKRAGTLGIAALGGLGVYGFTVKDEKAKSTFLLSTESFLLTGAFVQTLKHLTGRHRPYTGDPPDTFSGPGWSSQGGRDSFPSGDASSAFAIASVVASEYDNIVVPPLVYTLSTLIALGRVYNNAHWSSDIFIGSAIGYYTGKAIVASHRNNAKIISLAPILDGKTTGVMVSYMF
jgi:membrane-associated phospholipid phosphatase